MFSIYVFKVLSNNILSWNLQSSLQLSLELCSDHLFWIEPFLGSSFQLGPEHCVIPCSWPSFEPQQSTISKLLALKQFTSQHWKSRLLEGKCHGSPSFQQSCLQVYKSRHYLYNTRQQKEAIMKLKIPRT